MYKKVWCTCEVVVLLIKPIVFLTFSLSSASLDLKVPIILPRSQSWRAQSVANCGPAYDCKWRTGFLTRLFTHEKVTILLYFVSCRRIPDETMKARQIACVFFLNSDHVMFSREFALCLS